VPEFLFETATEKVTSNPVGLTVNTVQVNEQTDDINAEKNIMSAPFSWIELARWSGIGLAAVLIIAVIVLLLMRFVFNKKVTILPETSEVVLPAHVVALQKLEQIKTEKIWQQGQIKQFYTDITDVIREYLSGAYCINAMEMTTDEIVALVKKNKDLDEIRLVLKDMLELSDLVKFAKFVPLENENEKAVLDAFMIVEKTTKEEETEEKQEQEKTSEE
jgi:cell division protein YceG involved in septum cleavage